MFIDGAKCADVVLRLSEATAFGMTLANGIHPALDTLEVTGGWPRRDNEMNVPEAVAATLRERKLPTWDGAP